MKKVLFFILFLYFTSSLLAQSGVNADPEPQGIRKNSIYAQNFLIAPGIYYDRVIPFNSSLGVIPRVGVSWVAVPVIGASLYLGYGNGKSWHQFEFGGAYWDLQGYLFNLNYRYMGKKGLLLKAGFEYHFGEEAYPILAVGYSF